MNCLFCDSNQISKSYLPSTFFNGKKFDYHKCKACSLIFINPIPNAEDYKKMYPISYQDGVDKTILDNQYKKLIGLRYSYGYQFDLLKKNGVTTILDYGCGNANFLINANHVGLKCDGAEFSIDQVNILKNEIPGSNFYTIQEVLENKIPKYDVIRLSNVLEHLDNPKEYIKKIVQNIKPQGFLLVEGPIETNFSIALLTRILYFGLRHLIQPNWIVSHTPTHIIFTNRKNQKEFFKKCGLQEVLFNISEAPWPYPNSLKEAEGIVQKIQALIAQLSMELRIFNKNWGNIFIYFGRK